MRLATWNVNSIMARLPRLVQWLEETAPDVVCLQETKVADDQFPHEPVDRLGYAVAAHGLGRWNGVAILSRIGIDAVLRGLPCDETGFEGPEARAIAASCGGIRVWSVYVPNGREPGHPHYTYKLRWLESLRESLEPEMQAHGRLALCGDFNVAPTDNDVWDPAMFVNSTHVTPAEREAVAAITALGLLDTVARPLKHDRPFTYWDYRAGYFHKDFGMRIDLVLLTQELAGGVRDAYVDRNARKGTGPSDHAPVVVDIDL